MQKFIIKSLSFCVLCIIVVCISPILVFGKAPQKDFSDIPVNSEGDSLYVLGISADKENHFVLAADLFSQAIAQAKKEKNILLEARSLERLGSVCLSLSQDNLALKYYYEALPLFEMAGDKDGIAKVYNILGFYKISQEKYDTAISYYLKAEQLNEEIGNMTGVIHNKGNLAYLYETIGEFDKAKNINLDLINKLLESNDSLNLPGIYYNMSSLLLNMDSSDRAIDYIRKAIPMCEAKKDTSMLSSLYGFLGDIYFNRMQLDSAEHLLKKSLKCSTSLKVFEEEYLALRFLLRIDTLNGLYKKTIPKFKRMLDLKDSISEQKIRNNLEASELKYENQKQNNMLAIKNHELDEGKKINRMLRLLFLASMISIGFLLMIIILIRKNNARKKQILQDQLQLKECKIVSAEKDELIHKLQIENLENEIRIKEREQVSSAMSLEQKNELLGMINDKIKIAMASDGILSIPALNGIVGQIREQLKDSSKLDLFNQQFSRLHPDFYEKLKTAHPELTKSELKFCAFLKLKLSSHQISSILNVSPEAIRKSRYRIRKKMNLSRDIILEDHISGF